MNDLNIFYSENWTEPKSLDDRFLFSVIRHRNSGVVASIEVFLDNTSLFTYTGSYIIFTSMKSYMHVYICKQISMITGIDIVDIKSKCIVNAEP